MSFPLLIVLLALGLLLVRGFVSLPLMLLGGFHLPFWFSVFVGIALFSWLLGE
ncbi:MAG: hypothetical protein MUF49_16295 [Oculatellaceae cyanobacterium Prado106]|jgi:hypothetical protein|nr:hypothetical protein [Oculatellaceae cyanobacterium Prado106]